MQQLKEIVTQRGNSFSIVFADNYERSKSMSHYRHLSIKERESILKLSAEGKGIREISRTLGRSAGTISRELNRNSGKDGYWPAEARKVSEAEKEVLSQTDSRRSDDQGICAAEDTG